MELIKNIKKNTMILLLITFFVLIFVLKDNSIHFLFILVICQSLREAEFIQ